MAHDRYPKGAIQSMDEFQRLYKAQKIRIFYIVQVYKGFVELVVTGVGRIDDRFTYKGDGSDILWSFLDMNIIPNNYNAHYAFRWAADAGAYVDAMVAQGMRVRAR
jgi:hypothetical protein